MNSNMSYLYENNITISRFMLDHAIILLSLISFTDNETHDILHGEQKKYIGFLKEGIKLSYNNLSSKFLESNILISQYTSVMENKTCELYKVIQNSEINLICNNLITNSIPLSKSHDYENLNQLLVLNKKLIKNLNDSVLLLDTLYKKVGKETVTMYFPSKFIEHLIEEINYYIYTLEFLNKRINFTPTYVYKCKYDFNVFLKEHAEYLKNMMFPLNIRNCFEIHLYIDEFQKISEQFDDNVSPVIIANINDVTRQANNSFVNFNTKLIQNMLYNKYYASAIPLLSDHILRESNYVSYQLDIFKKLR